MNRLEEIKELRHKVQLEYFEIAQEIWGSDLEVSKKDSKSRKEYEKYRNKDRFLERIQAMEESIIEDLEYFNSKLR
nr:MAG TPA: hypothetical protein [Caudoviricetes sp.]